MIIEENISLAEHTTFKVGGPARFFCRISDEDDLVEAVNFALKKKSPIFVLGGGSNLLVSDKGFPGLVIKVEIMGIKEKSKEEIANRKDDTISIIAGAGELWDDLVDWTVERGFHGLENLSAIPGMVGAAPVQNVGAYGAEAAEVISNVRAFDTRSMRFVELSNADCMFAYRDSMFKHQKGRYIITHVTFRLSMNGRVNIAYRDVSEHFKAKKMTDPTIKQVRQAVIDIRWAKLPDWKLWGTAGSFFKNPVISGARFKELQAKYPGLPGFPEADGLPAGRQDHVKVSLGWILDKVCDVKGLCMDNACVYEKQALVIIAHPGATAESVVALSRELMKRVKDKTGIEIEGEVEWVN